MQTLGTIYYLKPVTNITLPSMMAERLR